MRNTSLGGGDQLARGAASAIFKLCPAISQDEWDERVGKRPEQKKKVKKSEVKAKPRKSS